MPSIRDTVLLLISDMGKKTVLVLAHYFLLPERANSGYILSIYMIVYVYSLMDIIALSQAWALHRLSVSNIIYLVPISLCIFKESALRPILS